MLYYCPLLCWRTHVKHQRTGVWRDVVPCGRNGMVRNVCRDQQTYTLRICCLWRSVQRRWRKKACNLIGNRWSMAAMLTHRSWVVVTSAMPMWCGIFFSFCCCGKQKINETKYTSWGQSVVDGRSSKGIHYPHPCGLLVNHVCQTIMFHI